MKTDRCPLMMMVVMIKMIKNDEELQEDMNLDDEFKNQNSPRGRQLRDADSNQGNRFGAYSAPLHTKGNHMGHRGVVSRSWHLRKIPY